MEIGESYLSALNVNVYMLSGSITTVIWLHWTQRKYWFWSPQSPSFKKDHEVYMEASDIYKYNRGGNKSGKIRTSVPPLDLKEIVWTITICTTTSDLMFILGIPSLECMESFLYWASNRLVIELQVFWQMVEFPLRSKGKDSKDDVTWSMWQLPWLLQNHNTQHIGWEGLSLHEDVLSSATYKWNKPVVGMYRLAWTQKGTLTFVSMHA